MIPYTFVAYRKTNYRIAFWNAVPRSGTTELLRQLIEPGECCLLGKASKKARRVSYPRGLRMGLTVSPSKYSFTSTGINPSGFPTDQCELSKSGVR
jgi:hypothetical protein